MFKLPGRLKHDYPKDKCFFSSQSPLSPSLLANNKHREEDEPGRLHLPRTQIDKSFMALLEREAAMRPGGIEVKHSTTAAGTSGFGSKLCLLSKTIDLVRGQ